MPTRHWGAADRGMLELVRLIRSDDWQPERASAMLRRAVPDPEVLRLMSARVQRAMLGRETEMARRAARTLAAASSEPQGSAIAS